MKSLIHTTSIIFICCIGMVATSCKSEHPGTETNKKNETTRAKAFLSPTQGNKVKGIVTFQKVGETVRIVADVEGLTPGEHGFHIHEFGDCSAPDGSSAGGHFNPHNSKHGSPEDKNRHAGDLGNITANGDGKGHYHRIDNVIKLNGDSSIIGRSVIIHSSSDDFVTQPTGNAGGRLSCGVIMIEK